MPKRKYFEVDALIDFESMERFKNKRDSQEEQRLYSAGQTVLDSLISLEARELSLWKAIVERSYSSHEQERWQQF